MMPSDSVLWGANSQEHDFRPLKAERGSDVYFSADVETDGPIPGPFSMLSFAIVVAGRFDGSHFSRPPEYSHSIHVELKPISDEFQPDALAVNRIDRERLKVTGLDPCEAMTDAAKWVRDVAGSGNPVLVAYPMSFDWLWLYWYFVRYSTTGSPFGHSRCFDIKTAFAAKGRMRMSEAGRSRLPPALQSSHPHTHSALDDAIEQAEIFANVFEWEGQP
jgi:hypothetical protein